MKKNYLFPTIEIIEIKVENIMDESNTTDELSPYGI